MKRSTHPEAYDYYLRAFETTPEIVDDMLDKLVIGIWEGHADIREGKPGKGGLKVIQCDVITENGVETLGPDYYGYVGESYEEAIRRELVEIGFKGNVDNMTDEEVSKAYAENYDVITERYNNDESESPNL